MLLGLDSRVSEGWPAQSEIVPLVNVTRARVSQLVGKFQERWAKDRQLNERYRKRFKSCHMKYSLAVPFLDRIFKLGIPGGCTGRSRPTRS